MLDHSQTIDNEDERLVNLTTTKKGIVTMFFFPTPYKKRYL